ncbi:hypothetical protein ACQUSR_29290 [Streptomyces sp. P1-3]|uniref:hypothetical protein n=1 Tax=Streptomyces sp. P1-3 TaxID=3421658 RepID=UPI003D35C6FA
MTPVHMREHGHGTQDAGLVIALHGDVPAVPAHRAARASTQGLVDVGVAIAGATGGMASGTVVASAGYSALAAAGAVLAIALLPLALAARPHTGLTHAPEPAERR